jgi:hypothetical protein
MFSRAIALWLVENGGAGGNRTPVSFRVRCSYYMLSSAVDFALRGSARRTLAALARKSRLLPTGVGRAITQVISNPPSLLSGK